MGIFDKILGRKSGTVAAPTKTQDEIQADCSHTAIMGRWDSVEDMGVDARATAYVCDSCQKVFEPEEGRKLRSATTLRLDTEHSERLRQRAERNAEQ